MNLRQVKRWGKWLTRQAERTADRVRFTLNAKQSVEYKFSMATGAKMAYPWSASGPAYADLHADHFDDPENFTSAKIATLSQDEGTYHGRHGWFWRNDGATPTTITLETTGEYTIIGVPR